VTGVEPGEVESIKRSARAPISLEKPVGDEEESEFGQLIADERAESPYERAVEILRDDAVRDALENLSYRERRVLELRYGLGGQQAHTLDEVGRRFNVTRGRVRQIETQSLNKLENLPEAQQLRDDIEARLLPALRCAPLGTEPGRPSRWSRISGWAQTPTEIGAPFSQPARLRRRALRPGMSSALARRSLP
jgi:hypothetical protein